MNFKDPNQLQHKALELIERHLDQLLAQGDVANSMAIVIQNYMKVLVMAAKDQRDQLRGFNPSSFTDAELDKLAEKAGAVLNEIDNSPNEENDSDQ